MNIFYILWIVNGVLVVDVGCVMIVFLLVIVVDGIIGKVDIILFFW